MWYGIVNKYNKTCHSSIKWKLAGVKASTYIDFVVKNNDKDPRFEVTDHVKISKYKNSFAKGYTPNFSEEVFVIKRVKNIVPCIVLYLIE